MEKGDLVGRLHLIEPRCQVRERAGGKAQGWSAESCRQQGDFLCFLPLAATAVNTRLLKY